MGYKSVNAKHLQQVLYQREENGMVYNRKKGA